MKLHALLLALAVAGAGLTTGCVVRTGQRHHGVAHPAKHRHQHCHDRGRHHKRVCHSHPHGPGHH